MKTVVYGLGISAISVLKILKNFKDEVFVINRDQVDLWKKDVLDICDSFICISEEDSFKILSDCDRIILSPGIPRSIKWLKNIASSKIIGEIEFAFINSNVPVIAITGSNGKTTTTTMIYEALKLFGKKVFIGGNIGIPYSDIIGQEYDFAVIEVSSFQLESIQSFKPVVSIITNLTPNHMERYSSFDEYKFAKYNIYKNQTSGLHIAHENNIKNKSVKFKSIKKIEGYEFELSKVIGDHNRFNFFCAREVCSFLCSNFNDATFQLFINSFKSPAFRLEYIATKNNLKFYNDSKSTNIESTLKAVLSFQKDIILILGGKLRENSVEEYKQLKSFEFKKILVFGEAKELLSLVLDVEICEDLASVFSKLKNLEYGNVLFSPGFPSFDLYNNFEHRGAHFNQLVASFKA